MPDFEVDIIRAILLELGERPPGMRWAATPVGGYTEDQTLNGVKAAMEENLIVGMLSPSGKVAMVYRMTAKRVDFLEESKHLGNWNRAKELVRSKGKPINMASVRVALDQLRAEASRSQ